MKRNKEFFQTLTNDFLSPNSSVVGKTKPKNSIEKQIFTFELNNNTGLSNSIEHVDYTTFVDRLSMPSSPSNSSSGSSSSLKQQYSKLTGATQIKPKLTHCLSSSPLLSPSSPHPACKKSSISSSDWKWKSEDGIRKKKKSRKDSWVQMASRVIIQDETICPTVLTISTPSSSLTNQSTCSSPINVNNTKPEESHLSTTNNTLPIIKPRIIRTSIKISELLN